MALIVDETIADLFMRQGPGSASLGAASAAGQLVFQAIGRWIDGQDFDESIVADSRQDAINKIFERFDPLVEQLTIFEIL